jgi:hypothetical protein
VKEGTFGALFSFPPYQRLPEPGKKYARRYWLALALLVGLLLVGAFVKEGAVRPTSGGPPTLSSGMNSR